MHFHVFKAGGAYAGLVSNNELITALILPDKKQAVLKSLRIKYPHAVEGTDAVIAKTAVMIRRYFDGEQVSFNGIAIDYGSLTPFVRRVLEKTRRVPYGMTKTYSWAGGGKARAAGNALGKNPVPLIVPCHRVIKTDGKAGGFAFGASWKKRLLGIERMALNKKVLKGE